MKKSQLLIFSFLVTFIGMCNVNISVYADESYKITHFKEKININRDGSAKVIYNLTYKFDDDMNGFYVNQPLDGGIKVKEPIIANVNGQKLVNFDGKKLGLEIINKPENKIFKIHYPVKQNNTYNVGLSYDVKNYVKRYKDVGEINKYIIGDNWDVDLNNVDILVTLPQKNQQKFATFSHNFIDEKFVGDKQQGTYRLKTDLITANEPVELHAYFDQSTINLASQVNENKRENIDQQEKQLAKKYRVKKMVVKIIQIILIGSFLIPLIIIVYANRYFIKKRDEASIIKDKLNNFDLPSNLQPAVVQVQLEGVNFNESTAFNATLMDLMARNYLDVSLDQKEKINVKKRDLLQFTLKKYDEQLCEFEIIVLKVLFGDKNFSKIGSIAFSRAFRDQHGQTVKRYVQKLPEFKKLVKKHAKSYELIDVTANNKFNVLKQFSFWAGLIIVVIYNVILLMNNFATINEFYISVGILMLISVFFIFISVLKKKSIYLKNKWQEANDWFNFKNMLKNIGEFDIKQVTDVILWDRYLAYAVALGVGKEVSDALAKYLPNDTDNTSLKDIQIYSIFTMLNMNQGSVFNTDFDSIGSSSGSMGGFSSGGSGSSGGGGAF